MFRVLQTLLSITFSYFFDSTNETNFSEIFTRLFWGFFNADLLIPKDHLT